MRILIAIFILSFIAISVHAEDIQICITIPEAKIDRLTTGFLEIRPIPDEDNDGNPDYTLKQWARINIINYLNGVAIEGNSRIREQNGRNLTDRTPMAE